jgi:hypothetical protein
VDVPFELERLAGFRGRGAGPDAERQAARHLAARLEKLGRDARIEPARVRPAFAIAHLIHLGLGIVGSVLAVYEPLAGLALVALALISTFGDLTGSFFLVRRLTPVRATQNIVSEEDDDKPGRLVLVAHYDAGRGGALYDPRLRRWPTVMFWSLVVIAVCAVVRLIGLEPTWLTVIQFIPTVALIAALPLFADVAVSGFEPGENRNASGVATVLRLAEQYGGSLEHFDLTVLLTGAEQPFSLGMRDWLRRHQHELDAEETAVVCVDCAAYGTPHYATKEGLIFPARYHPALVTICDELETAKAYVSREMSDAYLARTAGLPAIRISSLSARLDAPETIDTDALARTYDFMCDLLERIDEEIGPRLA